MNKVGWLFTSDHYKILAQIYLLFIFVILEKKQVDYFKGILTCVFYNLDILKLLIDHKMRAS